MTDETKQSIVEMSLRVAERFGVPVVLLGFVLWMTRDAAALLHQTLVVPMVENHTKFLDSTSKTLHEIGRTQDQQAETLRQIADSQREIHSVLTRQQDTKGE
jgi:hypothetical protein